MNSFSASQSIKNAYNPQIQNPINQQFGQMQPQYIPYYIPLYMPPMQQLGYTPQFMGNNNNNLPLARLPTPFNYSKQIKSDEDYNFEENNNNIWKNENKNNLNQKIIKKDPFEGKSAERIVAEFKAYTLPKLRLKRLIKLQAVIKGWLTRRFLIPKKKMITKFIENYANEKILSLLEDKIIPDIVLEVLTYNKYNEDVSLYSTEYRIFLEIMDKVCRNVVVSTSREIAKEASNSLVSEILRKRAKVPEKGEDLSNPLYLCSKDLFNNLLLKECSEIVKSSCKDISEEYIMESHFNFLIKSKLIVKPVFETINSALDEIIIEDFIENMVDRLCFELANPLAIHILDEFQKEFEGVELDKALDNYVDREILEILMEQLSILIDNKSSNNEFVDDINNMRKTGLLLNKTTLSYK